MESRKIYALGFFDGVHLGHQALLSACRDLAQAHGCQAGAVTFGTHPEALVLGQSPRLLNTVYDRELLLKGPFQMDTVVTLPFDRELMAMPWRDFMGLLRSQYNAAGFVCGDDFRFGSKGEGNARLLTEYCAAAGLPCQVVPEQRVGQIRISSSHIRNLVEEGKMEEAVAFLGHPHILTGQVVSGRKLGRTIGIPTANLLLPEETVLPRLGVYACRAWVEGKEFPAVTNIGTRPTVGGHRITVEPWILDFTGDLYGKTITLAFYSFLRPEKKFPSLEHLQEEIQKNAVQTRKILEKYESFSLQLGKLMLE